MSKPTHLVILVCLLAGALPLGTPAAAEGAATGQIIGLCYRDGSKGIVLEEILKTEGIPYTRLRDLDQLDALGVKGLFLGNGFDSSAEKVRRFLERGGAVLSLQPSGRLAAVMGLEETGVQKNGYLTVEGHGAEIISYEGRFQLFGLSKCYRGGTPLAALSSGNGYGGLIRVKHGSGTALVIAFDLATTLLTILQPEAECGKHIDASNVEYDLGRIPQVDLIRRLLVGLFLEHLDVPVLRKWYFPSKYRAMMAVIGDQDGASFAQLKVVLKLIQELKTPYTLYVTPAHQPVTKEQFRILAEGGMDFALHPDFFHGGLEFVEQKFVAQLRKAEQDVGGAIVGERPHSGRWDSVRELPIWAERAGVQYDSILGQKWWKSKPAYEGYWVGTGLPYSFIDPGSYRRLDVMEIPILFGDNDPFLQPRRYSVRYKPGAHKTFMSGRGQTEDEAFETCRRLLDEAIEKYHTVVGYCWHPVYLAKTELNLNAAYSTDRHFRKCISYAKRRGVGLTGTNALNAFWRARNKVRFQGVAWRPESLTAEYRLSSEASIDALTLISPLKLQGKRARICVNGAAKQYVRADVLGQPQAMFTVDVVPGDVSIEIKYD